MTLNDAFLTNGRWRSLSIVAKALYVEIQRVAQSEAERRHKEGGPPPYQGVPVALKITNGFVHGMSNYSFRKARAELTDKNLLWDARHARTGSTLRDYFLVDLPETTQKEAV